MQKKRRTEKNTVTSQIAYERRVESLLVSTVLGGDVGQRISEKRKV